MGGWVGVCVRNLFWLSISIQSIRGIKPSTTKKLRRLVRSISTRADCRHAITYVLKLYAEGVVSQAVRTIEWTTRVLRVTPSSTQSLRHNMEQQPEWVRTKKGFYVKSGVIVPVRGTHTHI